MKRMNQCRKRGLAWLLAVVLVFSLVPAVPGSAAKKAKLNKKSVKLKVGKTVKLKVKNNKKKVKWSSSKKKIATVSQKGLVKAKKAGKAKITAKIGKKKLVCKVTVVKKGGKSEEDPDDPYESEAPSASPAAQVSASPASPVPTASVAPTSSNPGGNKPGGNNPPATSNPGGNKPGEDNPGGNTPSVPTNPGEDNPGGDNPGGDNPSVPTNPGEDNPGGDNPGGDNPSVPTNPGEDNPGGDNPGGDNPSVTTNPGGDNPGEDNPGGDTPSVSSNPGGDTPSVSPNPGEDNPGEDNPGGDTPSVPTNPGENKPPIEINDRTAFTITSPQVNADAKPTQVPRTVTLGMKTAEVEKALSGGQIQKTKSPQGYDVIEYKTVGIGAPTTGYMVIYLDAGQVVSIFAVGRKLSYGNIIQTTYDAPVLSGTLESNGWEQDSEFRAQQAKCSGVYTKTVGDITVRSFVDSSRKTESGEDMDHRVFGIQVFPSELKDAMTLASTDFTYEDEQKNSMTREMIAIIQAYRYTIGMDAAKENDILTACAKDFLDGEIEKGLDEEPGRSEEELADALYKQYGLDSMSHSEIGAMGGVDAIAFIGYIMSAEDGRIARNADNIGVASGARKGTDQYYTFILIDLGRDWDEKGE